MNTDYTAHDVVNRLISDDAFRREFVTLLVELKLMLEKLPL